MSFDSAEHPAHRLTTLAYLFAILAVWLAAYITPVVIVIAALRACFKGSTGPVWPRFVSIIASYFAVILVFAGFYYVAAWEGDRNDAVLKYIHYEYEAVAAHLHNRELRRKADERTFRGMEQRFYSGVDWPVDESGKPVLRAEEAAQLPLPELVAAAARPQKQVVRFLPSSRLAMFTDCLYFSSITVATVGYGDISPRAKSVKVAASVEALAGIAILVVALGMLFGRWRPDAIEINYPQTAIRCEPRVDTPLQRGR